MLLLRVFIAIIPFLYFPAAALVLFADHSIIVVLHGLCCIVLVRCATLPFRVLIANNFFVPFLNLFLLFIIPDMRCAATHFDDYIWLGDLYSSVYLALKQNSLELL
ncbi:hypothetical protein DFP73DRAFT_565025 [Morchella snyderi]|nr:hypothetical protein DFP73DRAFT_565025 [Morchella snyderi]